MRADDDADDAPPAISESGKDVGVTLAAVSVAGTAPLRHSESLQVPDPEDIDLTCPISLELFENPVVASDGHTYSRAGIEEWFRNGHNNSPLTQERLELTLYPNRTVAKIVQKYKTTMGPREQT